MHQQSQLSRAALLACLRTYGREHLEACAAVLGYTPREPAPPRMQTPRGDRVEIPSTPSVTASTSVSVPGPEATPQVQFSRVRAQRPLEAMEAVRDVPLWWQQAVPFTEEVRAIPGLHPPRQAPLMPWARLWPWLRLVLGADVLTKQPDLARLIERLARGQPLRRVPRVRRQGWAGGCQVLIDYATELRPFWADYHTLQQRLRGLRGTQGLTLIAFPDGEPGGGCEVWTPQGWEAVEQYPLPVPGTPVLVLSDLGCLDNTAVRCRQWHRLGRRLRRAGCQPVALMPCPERCWDNELMRLFFSVLWDRGAARRRDCTAVAPAWRGHSCGTSLAARRTLSPATPCRCGP